MALNAIDLNNDEMQPHIEARLEAVAAMVARKMTQRGIVQGLAQLGIINPETKQPYSLGTINSDIKQLKKEWRKRRTADTETWLDEELSSLDILEQKAWSKKDYDLVLKIKARRSKYLGLDKPTASVSLNKDVTQMTDEELEKELRKYGRS